MKSVIFASILILFIPLFLSAQENIVAQQDYIKNDLNIYLDKSINSLQELSSNLVDEYGIKKLEFVKLENGNYIPVRTNEVKKATEVQFSSDVIIIFAIIGAVLVALLVLKSL